MTLQGELLKPSECRNMSEGVAKSSVRLQKCYMMHHMGEGSAGNVRITSYAGRGLKLLKKPSYVV